MSLPAIRQAETAADIAAVRQLCWAYRDFLLTASDTDREIITLFYPKDQYAALMDRIDAEHARPDGLLLLAEIDGKPVGCGMSHRLSATASEIKRVYITDAARGTGLGRAICTRLIEQARADGYQTVYLDTSKALTAARALYTSLGFIERGPYQPVPEAARDIICFYEMPL